MRQHPLLLIVTILLVFDSLSRQRQGYRVACAFAFGFGGGRASFSVATRARRRSIERLGNIPPSLTTQTTAVSLSSKILASFNYHHITYRNHHRNKSTTITMSANQPQEQQVQQRIEKISSISSPAILDNYDTFLLDMWGGKNLYCRCGCILCRRSTFLHPPFARTLLIHCPCYMLLCHSFVAIFQLQLCTTERNRTMV